MVSARYQKMSNSLVPPHQQMFDDVYDLVNERYEKKEIVYVDTLPSPRKLTPPVILGTYSHYCPKINTRYITLSDTVKMNDLHVSLGDIARAYLEIKYKCGKEWKFRAKTEAWEYFNNWHSVPIMAHPTTFDDGYYIDIKSAWYQIMCVSGWNLDYHPSTEKTKRWLMMGEAPYDLPFRDIKPLRSSLLSMTRRSSLRKFICPLCAEDIKCEEHNGLEHPYGTILIQDSYNKFFNPALWAFVTDVLNCIARDLLFSGCVVYVNNDGYICPTAKAAAKAIQILNAWQVSFSVKAHGAGWVRSVGNYRVGKHRSNVISPVKDFERVHNIPHHYWLRSRFRSTIEHRRAKDEDFNILFPQIFPSQNS